MLASCWLVVLEKKRGGSSGATVPTIKEYLEVATNSFQAYLTTLICRKVPFHTVLYTAMDD